MVENPVIQKYEQDVIDITFGTQTAETVSYVWSFRFEKPFFIVSTSQGYLYETKGTTTQADWLRNEGFAHYFPPCSSLYEHPKELFITWGERENPPYVYYFEGNG